MAKAKKDDSSTATKVAIGVGTGLAAALAAGAYYLYGTNDGKKKRAQLRGWMLKMKGDVMDQMEKVKEMNEDVYHKVIDTVADKYKKVKNIDNAEIESMVKDMKKHWKNIKAELSDKPAKKASKLKAKPKTSK